MKRYIHITFIGKQAVIKRSGYKSFIMCHYCKALAAMAKSGYSWTWDTDCEGNETALAILKKS